MQFSNDIGHMIWLCYKRLFLAPTDSGISDEHTVLFSGPMTISTDLLNADLQPGSDQLSDDVKTEIQEN